MPFLILNTDNSIADILLTGTDNEITNDDIKPIIKNKYGHVVFDYVGGVISLNQDRYDALLLGDNKTKYINELIDQEKTLMAKERLTGKITAINNAADQAALDALKT